MSDATPIAEPVANERPLGVIANPLSGRDVRRLAARAPRETPEGKRNQIQRAVIGAVAAGARRVLFVDDLFRVSEGAVELLNVGASIERLEIGQIRTRAEDTARAAAAMRDAGCGAVVVLGGDGTNRIVARAWPDVPVVPISTGTNNVFPELVEATMAGAAAGLVTSGRIALDEVSRPSKIVRAEYEDGDVTFALIDAVLLVDEHVGSLLPFDPVRVRRVVLSRAEPAAVGMSPIGGLLHPAGRDDDFGVDVECSAPDGGGRPLLVPVSPGLYRSAHVLRSAPIALGETVELRGPGVLAFDGDRERKLAPGERVQIRVVREGPRAIDVGRALTLAAQRGLYLDRGHFHDGHDEGGGFDCC